MRDSEELQDGDIKETDTTVGGENDRRTKSTNAKKKSNKGKVS